MFSLALLNLKGIRAPIAWHYAYGHVHIPAENSSIATRQISATQEQLISLGVANANGEIQQTNN